MNEILLQTIIEKLEALEISLLKSTPDKGTETHLELLKEIRSCQSEIAAIFHQIKTVNEKINEMSKNVMAMNFSSSNKLSEQVHHRHHLHRGIWIAITLFITSILLSYGWINSYNGKQVLEANDLKYRYLKVINDVLLTFSFYSFLKLQIDMAIGGYFLRV